MSIHPRGRICILDEVDAQRLAEGIKPNCKDHYHTGRVKAFELCRVATLGRILVMLGSRATTEDDPAPSGVFIEIGGYVEYCHLSKTTKPNLRRIYALGKQVAAGENRPFLRRNYYPLNTSG